MCNKNLKTLSCMVLVTGALSGLTGCSCMPPKPIRTEEITITSDVDDTTTECDAEEPDTGRDSEDLAGDDTGLGEWRL